MITVTLEVNKKCNLSCDYCYIGEKDNKTMKLETAIQSIIFAIERINDENHKYRSIKVNFLGGEPLLDLSLIKEIVYYCEMERKKQKIDFTYTITTNGVLLIRKTIDFLVKYNFSLKISLDGNEKINDISRKTINGAGSYRFVVKNLDNIKLFEKKTGKAAQVSAVITKTNYKYLFDTIRHFHEELGFLDIDVGIDREQEWKDEELQSLYYIYNNVLTYYINSYKQNNCFMWRYIESALDNFKNINSRLYLCGAGIVSFYVNTEGEMFLCPALLNSKYSLGNVFDGFSNFGHLVREKLSKIKEIDNEICRNCKDYRICKSKGCFASSLSANGDVNIPDKFSCQYARIGNELVKNNIHILEEIQENARIVGPKEYTIKI